MKRIISITFIIVILALMPEIARAAVSKIGSDMRITNAPGSSTFPSLASNGSGYGVSWVDTRDGSDEIYFARIDASGNKIGSDVRITTTGSASIPSLVWTGTEYGVSWLDGRGGAFHIYFARIDATGSKIGSDTWISDTADTFIPYVKVSLAWAGTGYGVSWNPFLGGVYFARIDASGNKIGSDVTIYPSYGTQDPSMTWTGFEYGMSWAAQSSPPGSNDIYFARLDASGNKIGSEVQVSDGAATHKPNTSIVWTGAEYGISWEDCRDGGCGGSIHWEEIYFARISATGAKIGSDMKITTSESTSQSIVSLQWDGTEYGVSWTDHRNGPDEIYFAQIDASGNKIGSDLRITTAAAGSRDPSLVWTGTEYGVSWRDDRDGNAEIYFARIADSAPIPIGNIYPPTPTQHFYGDADGDTAITVTDLNIIVNYINTQPYTFYTLQPDTPDADWNTCDVDSDQVLTVTDKNILVNYINAQPVSIPDKPWTLQGVNIPAGDNYTGAWIPFNASLSSLNGTSGRPGISVVATIKPVGQGSTTTGSLHGRTCSPTAGPPRDQPAEIGAQCALAVTITDWMAYATDGLTEEPYDPPNGHLGFEIQGDTPGIIMINLRVEDAYLDIPALSINVPVFFITAPTINLPPVWQTAPQDIYVPPGVLYNQINGVLTDPNSGQTLSCSSNSSDCYALNITVSGTGPAPLNCNISFQGGGWYSCHLRVIGSDNGFPPLTVGQTIYISVF